MNTANSRPAGGSPPALRASAHRWKVLAAGVMANASFSAAAAGIPTTAVWLRADYCLDNTTLGWVLGAMGLGLALSEVPWGMVTDRVGDRPVLVTGLLGTAFALFAMGLWVVPSGSAVPAAATLAAAMVVVGMLGGSVNGSSGRAIMSWFAPAERGLAMSIRQTAVPLGGGLGAALLPWLASTAGFGHVFAAVALMCAASAVAAWRWLRPQPGDAAPGKRRAAASAQPLADFRLWRMALGIGVLCMPQFAVLAFAAVFLHDSVGLGIRGISATMAALQTGAIVMRIWSGRHTDRHGNRRGYLRGSTLAICAAFAALAWMVAATHPVPAAAAVIMVVLAGVCVSAWHGVAYAELATLAGAERAGTALGMANTIVYVSFFVAPSAVPYLLGAGSWASVWASAALVALLVRPLFPRQQPRLTLQRALDCPAK